MTRAFKPVAFILLLAFISPGLWALSNCMEKGLEADRCAPKCPIMQMSMDAGEQISAQAVAEHPCCKSLGGLPVSDQAVPTPQTSINGNLPLAIMAMHAVSAPVRVLSSEGTTPPVPASSQQALLCVFLV